MQRGETGRGGPEPADPDEVNAARLRLLIAAALGQLSAGHRAVISRSYYLGWTTAQIADDLHIAEWFVKARPHFAVRRLRLTLERSPPAVHGRTRLERSWTRRRAQEETLGRDLLCFVCLTCTYMVELRVGLLGIEPLTYPMRTNVSRRLLRKGVLVAT